MEGGQEVDEEEEEVVLDETQVLLNNVRVALNTPPSSRTEEDCQFAMKFCEKVSALRKIPEATLRTLCQHMYLKRLPKDTPLFYQGERGNAYYITFSGRISLYAQEIDVEQQQQREGEGGDDDEEQGDEGSTGRRDGRPAPGSSGGSSLEVSKKLLTESIRRMTVRLFNDENMSAAVDAGAKNKPRSSSSSSDNESTTTTTTTSSSSSPPSDDDDEEHSSSGSSEDAAASDDGEKCAQQHGGLGDDSSEEEKEGRNLKVKPPGARPISIKRTATDDDLPTEPPGPPSLHRSRSTSNARRRRSGRPASGRSSKLERMRSAPSFVLFAKDDGDGPSAKKLYRRDSERRKTQLGKTRLVPASKREFEHTKNARRGSFDEKSLLSFAKMIQSAHRDGQAEMAQAALRQSFGKHIFTLPDFAGFGELSLVSKKNPTRSTGAVADEDSEVIIIDLELYDATLFPFHMRTFNVDAKMHFLQHMPMFDKWSTKRLTRVAYGLEFQKVGNGGRLYARGQPADKVFFLTKGTVCEYSSSEDRAKNAAGQLHTVHARDVDGRLRNIRRIRIAQVSRGGSASRALAPLKRVEVARVTAYEGSDAAVLGFEPHVTKSSYPYLHPMFPLHHEHAGGGGGVHAKIQAQMGAKAFAGKKFGALTKAIDYVSGHHHAGPVHDCTAVCMGCDGAEVYSLPVKSLENFVFRPVPDSRRIMNAMTVPRINARRELMRRKRAALAEADESGRVQKCADSKLIRVQEVFRQMSSDTAAEAQNAPTAPSTPFCRTRSFDNHRGDDTGPASGAFATDHLKRIHRELEQQGKLLCPSADVFDIDKLDGGSHRDVRSGGAQQLPRQQLEQQFQQRLLPPRSPQRQRPSAADESTRTTSTAVHHDIKPLALLKRAPLKRPSPGKCRRPQEFDTAKRRLEMRRVLDDAEANLARMIEHELLPARRRRPSMPTTQR